MKTFAILVAGLTVTSAIPTSACDPATRAMADEAHALAAELAAAATPYAPYGGDWARVARDAVRADAAAAEVLCGLDRGNYCDARDAAEELHDLAEDLQEDVEDLDFRPGRWRRPCPHTHGGLAQLADRLEEVSSDLRRAVKRLDEGHFGRPVRGGGPIYGGPVRVIPSSPIVIPGRGWSYPGNVYEDSWSRRTQGGSHGVYDRSFEAEYVTPSATFGDSPTVLPAPPSPDFGNAYPVEGGYRGFESGGVVRSYGLERGVKVSPGQLKKIERRPISGPVLVAP